VREGGAGLTAGLIAAVASAAAINLGYLLQHSGLGDVRVLGDGRAALLRASFRSRRWRWGQTLGIAGFAVQVAAVAIAPLSLVQAFAAGGLALSVPLASRLFGHRVTRRQAFAVGAMAAALAVLPLGLPDRREQLHELIFYLTMLPLLVAALFCASRSSAAARAVGAGLAYGVADAAVKALSVRWQAQGVAALASPWTALFLAGTLTGFIALQGALREAGPVTAVSLMTAFATLVSLSGGLAAFGESFGTRASTVVLHGAAVAVVLACVRPLAAAQAEIDTRAQAEA